MTYNKNIKSCAHSHQIQKTMYPDFYSKFNNLSIAMLSVNNFNLKKKLQNVFPNCGDTTFFGTDLFNKTIAVHCIINSRLIFCEHAEIFLNYTRTSFGHVLWLLVHLLILFH